MKPLLLQALRSATVLCLAATGLPMAGAQSAGDCRPGPGALCMEARLTGVDLKGADLARADFSDADLRGADLTGARIDATTDFTGANMRHCTGCPPPTR